jgi:hypothetical protein
MARPKRPLKLHIYGQRLEKPNARRVARGIVRLVVELDAEQAQTLADTLEHEEALRRKAVRRARRSSTAGDRR